MPTPAILNTSSVTPNSKSAAKPAESAASDNAFTQMLSRQMDERRSASNADQARAANKADEADKARENSATRKAAETASSGKSPAPAKADDGSASTEAAGAPADKDAQTTAGDASPTPSTATELLALAAQEQVKRQADATRANVATAADAAAAIGKQRLSIAAEEVTGAQAQTDGADSTDFKATLEQSRQAAKGLPDAISAAKLQDGLPMSGAVPQLQQAGFDITQAATGRVTDRLTPQVGTPAWDQAVGQKVVWMVTGNQQSASLTLNPPDLGPLQVVLNVSNGQADASFYAAQPEVRQALEAALPKLREMMNEAGVTLGQTTVSAGMPDQHNQPGRQSTRQASHGQGTSTSDASAPVARTPGLSNGQGLVDTFA